MVWKRYTPPWWGETLSAGGCKQPLDNRVLGAVFWDGSSASPRHCGQRLLQHPTAEHLTKTCFPYSLLKFSKCYSLSKGKKYPGQFQNQEKYWEKVNLVQTLPCLSSLWSCWNQEFCKQRKEKTNKPRTSSSSFSASVWVRDTPTATASLFQEGSSNHDISYTGHAKAHAPTNFACSNFQNNSQLCGMLNAQRHCEECILLPSAHLEPINARYWVLLDHIPAKMS